jgi:hypothetical protein
VEVRNTPSRTPIVCRDSAELSEDLCLALREVAISNRHLSGGAAIVEKTDAVKAVYSELSKRGIELASALSTLSEKTNWKMADLLADCLAYPARIPEVKGLDDVRERFRCQFCRQAEHPEETLIWMCAGCLNRVIEAIESRVPFPGIFLYRTYNESRRCPHADSETVLASSDDDWFETGRCTQCILDEKQKRSALITGLPE